MATKSTSDIIEEEIVAMQDWLDYLVKVGYINAKFDVRSFAQRILEAGKKEGAGEVLRELTEAFKTAGWDADWHNPIPFVANYAQDHGLTLDNDCK